jgi:AraC-like DNA-binding protein
MRAAKKFLSAKENADYPLIHLALDLGYPSPAPFNRAFKEATGVAPGEYRKRIIADRFRLPDTEKF